MTGITRVSKESVFSDLNNLVVVTTTSDRYVTSFGFTFGTHKDIYNPWSVLNFLSTEKLLKGETVSCSIDEQIVYEQLGRKKNAIWSLLLASGYLKVIRFERVNEIRVGAYPNYELALTNYEVKNMFMCMVTDWFDEAGDSYSEFVKALLNGDKKAMNVYMNRVTLEIFSYFDIGKRASGAEPERFYHGFVLGLIAELSGAYVITSNRESGFGRYDIMIEPKDKTKDALILEFKVHDPEDEKNLKDTVKAALRQIEEKQYKTALVTRGFPAEHIRKYGFAFRGKEVLIG